MDEPTYTCCICGGTHRGYGNNPAPVKSGEDLECCDYCNRTVVMAERWRLAALHAQTDGTKNG